jgi:O-antigen ligase
MELTSNLIKNKILHVIVASYLITLAYSESIKNVTLAIMLCYFLFQLISRNISINKDLSNISIIAHISLATIGIWLGVNPSESISQIGDVFKITVAFLFFKEINLDFINYEKIINYILFGFILAIIISISNYLYFGQDRLELRSVGSINRSATYIMYIFVIALVVIDKHKSKLSVILSSFALFLAAISIILGGSRMAIFSLLPVVIYYLFISRKTINKKIIKIIFSLILLLVSVLLISYLNNTLTISKLSLGFVDNHRIQIWISGLYIWLENNWLFGIGTGNSIFFHTTTYFENSFPRRIDNFHSVYLDMLVERGFLGLATFIMFMSSLFFHNDLKKYEINSLLPLLTFSLLLMGFANITFRYEFALLFVTIVGAYLNPSCLK